MAFTTITASQTDAKSPIDEDLMDTGLRLNFDDHETRILALEGAGTGTGGTSILALQEEPAFGQVVEGMQTNCARLDRGKWHTMSSRNFKMRQNLNAYDPIDPDLATLHHALTENDTASRPNTDAEEYLGFSLDLKKNEKRSFRVKVGYNYFGLFYTRKSTTTDSVTVTVDGVAVNTAGLVDEEGTTHSATFTTVSANTRYQTGKWFFGLDPDKEQTVVVENTDSGTDVMLWEATEVGFATEKEIVAVGHADVVRNAGTMLARGAETTLARRTLSFDSSVAYGRIDAEKSDSAGSVTTIKGAECAMTVLRPDEVLAPADTSLEVQSALIFPDRGFVHLQTGFSDIIASYTGKTTTDPQSHSLDGVIFDRDFEDFTASADFGVSTDMKSDVLVNLIASGDTGSGVTNAVEVSSSNNKIDFKIGLDGAAATTHAATVTSGLYSGDKEIMYLGEAITAAMETAKSLPSGYEYFADYSKETQKWRFGVKGNNVETFELLFSSGANQANSIHGDMGYNDTDLTGSLSYDAQTEVRHRALRCFDRGVFQSASGPNVKTNFDPGAADLDTVEDDIRSRWGLSDMESTTQAQPMHRVWATDEHVCGMEFTFANIDTSAIVMVQMEDGHLYYARQTDDTAKQETNARGDLKSFFVTFPMGSVECKVYVIDYDAGKLRGFANQGSFVGYRELRPHAPFEKCDSDESAFKFYRIRPRVYFKEVYAHDYAVQSNAFERVDTITFNGSWSTSASTTDFNGTMRQTSTSGDDVDLTVTLVGTGMIGIKTFINPSQTERIDVFIASGGTGTSAAANLVARATLDTAASQEVRSLDFITIGPYPAGQYTVRFENQQSAQFSVLGFVVCDETESEPEANSVGELTNNDRSIGFPYWGCVHLSLIQDQSDRTPPGLEREGYNEGKVLADYAISDHVNFQNRENDVEVSNRGNAWYANQASTRSTGGSGQYFGTFAMCDTIFSRDGARSVRTTIAEPRIDARNDSTYSQRVQVKAGSAPSSGREDFFPLYKKNFNRLLSANMPDSTTVNITDTRGVRNGQRIRVTADGQTDEYRRVTAVTTDTSLTLNKAISGFANFTTANNAKVHFGGFKRLKITENNAQDMEMSNLSYLPLAVQEIMPFKDPNKVGEIAKSEMIELATGDDLNPPVFADGRVATWEETIVVVTNKAATQSYDFSAGFKDITISTGTIDVKMTAIRRF